VSGRVLVRFLVGAALATACARPRPAPPSTPDPPPTPADPSRPVAAWFGTFDDETGKFSRHLAIPKVTGQSFGWRIKIRCTGPVRFREVMRLPAPGDFSFTPAEVPGTIVSDDQTTTTTVDYAACKQGWLEHHWIVAAGDPAGTYVITVELEGYAPQTFRPRFVATE